MKRILQYKPLICIGGFVLAFLYGFWGWVLLLTCILCAVKLSWMQDPWQKAKVTSALLLLVCLLAAFLIGRPPVLLLLIAGVLAWSHFPVRAGSMPEGDPGNPRQ